MEEEEIVSLYVIANRPIGDTNWWSYYPTQKFKLIEKDPTSYLPTSLFTQLSDVLIFIPQRNQQSPPSCVMLRELTLDNRSLNPGARRHKYMDNSNGILANRRHPTTVAHKYWIQTLPWATTRFLYQFVMTNRLIGDTNWWRHKYKPRSYLIQKFKLIGRGSTSYFTFHYLMWEYSNHTWFNILYISGQHSPFLIIHSSLPFGLVHWLRSSGQQRAIYN